MEVLSVTVILLGNGHRKPSSFLDEDEADWIFYHTDTLRKGINPTMSKFFWVVFVF